MARGWESQRKRIGFPEPASVLPSLPTPRGALGISSPWASGPGGAAKGREGACPGVLPATTSFPWALPCLRDSAAFSGSGQLL